MAMDSDLTDPETRLSQFLYVGKEYPDYQPGNWFVHNYFLAKNVPSIEELAEDTDKQWVPIQIITKVKSHCGLYKQFQLNHLCQQYNIYIVF